MEAHYQSQHTLLIDIQRAMPEGAAQKIIFCLDRYQIQACQSVSPLCGLDMVDVDRDQTAGRRKNWLPVSVSGEWKSSWPWRHFRQMVQNEQSK